MHRVAVTGIGMVTALGLDTASVWKRLLAGENGIGPITYFDASQYRARVAAELRNLPPIDTGLEGFPDASCRRSARVFLHGAREAFRDAGLDGSAPPAQVGVAAGISVNYVHVRLIRHHYQFRRPAGSRMDLERFAREGCQPAFSFYRRQGELLSTVTAKMLGLAGPTLAVDTACAASAFAIGEAFRAVQRGRALAMVAGGATAIVSPIGILAFTVLGALSANADPEQASRPFDRRRDGFVMGEGGGAVVLERMDHALARGARIYAELAGFGSTMTAVNLTDPSADGSSEERAMRLALADGKIAPAEIGYIAAHGTSTQKNDMTETRAIKRLLGAHAGKVAVSSNKGQIGHTIAGAGVCNLICAIKAIHDGWVPPTAHYREADPECDLDYVPNRGRPARVGAALANAFAFGGQNAALAVKAA